MHRGIDLPHLNGHIHTTPTSTRAHETHCHRLTARLHRMRYFSRSSRGTKDALRSPRKNHTNEAPSSASLVIMRDLTNSSERRHHERRYFLFFQVPPIANDSGHYRYTRSTDNRRFRWLRSPLNAIHFQAALHTQPITARDCLQIRWRASRFGYPKQCEDSASP